MRNVRLWPEKLDYYSSLIGMNKALTQGPGGNTSLKLGEYVWVKASGLHLADAKARPIFCQIHRDKPNVSLSGPEMRPSIESFLHAYIPHPVVVHVHSLGAIALAIRRNLVPEHLSMLDKHNLGYLGYVRPGQELGNQILQLIREKPQHQGVLLKNHGIVLWGNQIDSVYEALIRIEKDICSELEIDTTRDVSKEAAKSLGEIGFLTPDHAVFFEFIQSRELSQRNSWIKDLVWCLTLALESIRSNENIEVLKQCEVDELREWDLEKRRKKQ